MNILADTHILLWALCNDKQLSKIAREYLTDTANEIYYSSISVWEIEIKHKLHPDIIKIDGKTFARYCSDSGFRPFNFSVNHAALCESLNYPQDIPVHKDPFDKALIAQAKSDNFMLMTHDQKISYYNEPCILFV